MIQHKITFETYGQSIPHNLKTLLGNENYQSFATYHIDSDPYFFRTYVYIQGTLDKFWESVEKLHKGGKQIQNSFDILEYSKNGYEIRKSLEINEAVISFEEMIDKTGLSATPFFALYRLNVNESNQCMERQWIADYDELGTAIATLSVLPFHSPQGTDSLQASFALIFENALFEIGKHNTLQPISDTIPAIVALQDQEGRFSVIDKCWELAQIFEMETVFHNWDECPKYDKIDEFCEKHLY